LHTGSFVDFSPASSILSEKDDSLSLSPVDRQMSVESDEEIDERYARAMLFATLAGQGKQPSEGLLQLLNSMDD